MRFSDYLPQLQAAMQQLDGWRASYGPYPSTETPPAELAPILQQLAQRLQGNYPFHHPSYAGQMLKPPHPIAWAAYALASTINPNNHALDGGPPTSALEKEAVALLAQAFGFAPYLGHLTSSGTIANLEALWVARELAPGKAVAYSSHAHYTHSRMCQVLGVQGIAIPANNDGSWNMQALEDQASAIGTLVVTLGTTGLGLVEPLHELLPWAQARGIRVHVDAAYGGFFHLLRESGLLAPEPWRALPGADSLVVDPHKHGLQPYGCGCVLFADPAVGKLYLHDSPYTYFSSSELHLGEISLECSRAGASAAALWATLQLLPLEAGSGLGPRLAACLRAAQALHAALAESQAFDCLALPQLDILGYGPTVAAGELDAATEAIFRRGMQLPPAQGFHVSVFTAQASQLPAGYTTAQQHKVLRSVLLKPEHEAFVPTLVNRLLAAAQATG